MSDRQKRAVGSNQYVERLRDVFDPVDLRPGERLRPKPSGPTIGQFSNAPLREKISQHKDALATHLDSLMTLDPRFGEATAAREVVDSTRVVAATEDAIMNDHPSLYGASLIAANETLVKFRAIPQFREAYERGDQRAVALIEAADFIVRDAELMSSDPDIDRISQSIEVLKGGGEWETGALMTRSSSTSDEEMALASRLAALSVASLRVSDSRRADIVQQMNETAQAWKQSRLRALG